MSLSGQRRTYGYGGERSRRPQPKHFVQAYANRGLAYSVMTRMGVESEPDRDECFSDACLPCLVRCSARYDPRRAKFSTLAWPALYRAISQWRSRQIVRRGRFVQASDSPDDDGRGVQETFCIDMTRGLQVEELGCAMAAIPSVQRLIIACVCLHGMSLMTVGAAMSRTASWVGWQRDQALKSLRHRMGAGE